MDGWRSQEEAGPEVEGPVAAAVSGTERYEALCSFVRSALG
jgi:hypothetical protein